MRRILAGVLSFALVALSPGLEPYGALAATVSPRVQAKIASPSTIVSGNPLSTHKLPSSVLGQSGALPLLTPSVIPQVAVNPAAVSVSVTVENPVGILGQIAPVLETVTAELSKPGASNESAHSTGRRLDGTYSRDKDDDAVVVSVPAAKPSGLKSWLRRTVVAVGLSLAVITGAQGQTTQRAQNVPVPAAVAQDTTRAPQVAQAPVAASLKVEGQDLTVGSRVKLTLTLKNTSADTLKFAALRTAVNDALPENIDVISGEEGEIVLAAGESRTFVFEAEIWASGKFELGDSPVALQTVAGAKVFMMPAATVDVATVLTPDWKEKGFRDIASVLNALAPSLLWLAAIPLGLLMLYGVERFIAARRKYPTLSPSRLPIVLEAQKRLAALKNEKDPAAFYAELQALLTRFTVDFPGIKRSERDASKLVKDLKSSKAYKTGPLQVVSELLKRAEAVRFGRVKSTPEQRASDLRSAKALVDFVAAGQVKKEEEGEKLNAGGLAGFSFANPLVLLLLIPAGLMLAWKWRKTRAPAYGVASAAKLPDAKSLRSRLWWLPRSLRGLAMLAILVALSGPQLGVDRQTVIQPSADKMFVLDLSGSMDEPAGNMSKLQAASRSIATVANEARRGTQDRIGLTTFSDEAYIDIKLTTDYDAIISHLKELRTTGSTAIGKGMLSAIGHFIELNILEESESTDPRMQEVVRLLRTDGLPAALEYAKNDRQLMEQIIRPDRKKAVIVFTDGQSNSGITPVEASAIAKKLGIKVYTVGIGSGGGLDESTLQQVAENTGAQYFRADDPQRMAEVMHEISRMEKSPVKIVSTVAVNDLSKWFVLLALLGFGFELALVNTRLRTLHAMAFALTLPLAAPMAVAPATPAPYVQMQAPAAQTAPDPGPVLSLEKLPAEALQANRAYNEGRYDEALKLYTRALERYPDLIELHYNIGNTYVKLGDPARAKAAYERFLALNKSAEHASQAYYNLGNVGLMAQDAQAAKEMYKEALRKNPSNADAKWNLEVLNKLMEEQEKQQQQQQNQQQQDQKGKKDKKIE
jgi:Ca-activated chloride channel family protein